MKIAYNKNCAMSSDEWISLYKPSLVFNQCFHPELDNLVQADRASKSQLLLAHDPRYVDDVLNLRATNGFGDMRNSVMDQILWANGAMIAATREAMRSGICFAPVNGFHHAGHNFNGGYCTFNGLVISAIMSKKQHVLIIDGDGHYGDGTDDCIRATGCSATIRNFSSRDGYRSGADALKELGKVLKYNWDLVLYQAGADSHELDSFGVGYLNDNEWRARDEMVFKHCHDSDTPVVWNIAGGYSGTRTVNLHYDTFVTACKIYEPEKPRQRLRHPSGNSPSGYGSCLIRDHQQQTEDHEAA